MLLLSQASLGAPSSWECDGNIFCHYGRICRGIFWPWSCQIPRNALLEHFLNNSFTFFTFLTSEKSYFYHRQKPVSKFRSYIYLAQVLSLKLQKWQKFLHFSDSAQDMLCCCRRKLDVAGTRKKAPVQQRKLPGRPRESWNFDPDSIYRNWRSCHNPGWRGEVSCHFWQDYHVKARVDVKSGTVTYVGHSVIWTNCFGL